MRYLRCNNCPNNIVSVVSCNVVSCYEERVVVSFGTLHYALFNAAMQVLAEKFAALEGTEAAVVTSSGMAAITTTLLTFLAPGDHLMTADALYGGTYDFTKQVPLKSNCLYAVLMFLLYSGKGGALQFWEVLRSMCRT